MLFDIRPKKCRKDLYNFDKEYEQLVKYLGQPLVVVRGLRRTGKTSLILTALEETGTPYILFDLRAGFRSRRELYRVIADGLSDFIKRSSMGKRVINYLIGLLKSIDGISIYGFHISLSWRKGIPLITEVFKTIDHFCEKHGFKIVIVFDEIQRLQGPLKTDVVSTIAYSFDYLDNLGFILSGSEMGLFYEILSNPDSPLYGRAYVEVLTRKLSRSESIDFLHRGFSELGFRVGDDEIMEAVDRLDGVIGWLTYYGYSRVVGGRSLDDIVADAVELARKELENFLKYRVSRRYRFVLKALAHGVKEWRPLKKTLEDIEKRSISNRVLHDIIAQLRKHSIINDNLEYTDPIVKEAAKKL